VSDNRNDEWFAEWFDTPWYHVLYGNRSDEEAEAFINRLYAALTKQLNQSPSVLDLACGAGRHSRVFNALGCQVTGFDLSEKSIRQAREIGPASIRYVQGDMRRMQFASRFDLVVNLFTSFGYFDSITDNLAVLSGVHAHLQPGGLFVLAFFNAPYVIERLVANETVVRGGIAFDISRYATDTHIVKEIRFEADNRSHVFVERVQALSPQHLETMLTQQSFALKTTYGDYNLSTFAPQHSPRVIIVAQRV
jgi:SAM-dependent methyltransferase